MKNTQSRSSGRWLALLGERLARHRLNQNLSQAELAERAGVSVRTASRLENGEATQLDSFLRVLIALGLDGGLERLVPDVPASPIQQLERGGKRRRRASGTRSKRADAAQPWQWGDPE